MGMTACYMEADESLIEEMKNKATEEIMESIEELEEEGELEVNDMDKLWDGLHYLLTGASAVTPVKNNLLSEAVVGAEAFSDDIEEDYITYSDARRVQKILAAINAFDIDSALAAFSPLDFANKKVYPAIWKESEKEGLRKELLEEFVGLKAFYANMVNRGKGVIVSIY